MMPKKYEVAFVVYADIPEKGLQYWRFGMQWNTEKLQLLFFKGCKNVFHNFC